MSIPVEAVAAGHPDKLADYISDVILDTYRKHDKASKTAIEVVVYSKGIFVTGEVRSKISSIEDEIRERIILSLLKIYGNYKDEWLTNLINYPKSIILNFTKQSKELSRFAGEDRLLSGDQGVVIGYATDESPTYLPLAFSFAQRLMKEIFLLRLSGKLPDNLPDGKALILTNENHQNEIESVFLSLQHKKTELSKESKELIQQLIEKELFFHYKKTKQINLQINTDFREGGPAVDTGLTGRKTIIDSYGPSILFGGGAYSGKDISKVDRLCAYYARWVAKHVVAAKLAKKCYVYYSAFIGKEEVLRLNIDCLNTEKMPIAAIKQLLKKVFSLRYIDMIQDLNLVNFIYEKTSLFGHFTREDLPWEILNNEKINSLKTLFVQLT